ncbi:MAG: putative Ig domain-containing protein, partial [Candidatus Accumulibacter sp.]|nr:putative Ig domain-containing protein [Candidatus Accumulibacter necessarius]
TYTATKSDGTSLPSWLSFNPSTRTFSGTTPDIELTSWTIRVTATDPSGASVYDDFTISTTWQNGGGGQQQSMSTTFEMGMSEETLSQGATQSSTSSGPVAVQVKEQWFTYDALNRIKVSGGVLVAGVPGQSNASIQVAADKYDSYELGYDAVGHLVATYRSYTYNTQSQVHVDWTSYDARGNRQYEFYRQLVGVSDPGVKSQYFYDADNQLVEVRTYMPNDTVKDGPLDGEGFPLYRVDVSGMLLTGQRMQYDADGRLLRQDTLERGEENWWYHPTWSEGAPAAQYNDLSVLSLKERVDYTLTDGTAAWNDTDPTNNASGYDGAGRLVSYRYSAKQSGSFYTHTFTSTFTGWDSWQEGTVTGASTNSDYKPTTNTLTYDGYGRLTQQREHTEYQSNAIDDRIRAYAYNAEGQVQARRDGTWHNSGFVQDTTITSSGAQEKQNYQFVFSAGQQMAELQAGGTVRVAESVDALAQYLSARGAELSPTLTRQMTPTQNNRLSAVTGVAGSGGYTAGGGMVTVLQGETLQGLAQRVYGTSTLWYVLADANGLSDPNAQLTAGVQLKAPSASVNVNDANTFKPYNPSEATGPTSPSLPYIPPPPQAGCNTLALILIVVIVVIVTVATWGAASGAIVASGNAALTGAATASGLSFAGGMVAGAAAGAAGALAGQVAGSLMGVSSFSWRNVAAGAVTGALTGGVAAQWGSAAEAIHAGAEAGTGAAVMQGISKAAAIAVTGAGAGYVGQKLAGLNPTFSWKSIAAEALTTVVAAGVSESIGLSPAKTFGGSGDFFSDFGNGLINGVVGVHMRRAFGFNDKIDYGVIAATAFGQAIGNASGRGIKMAHEREGLEDYDHRFSKTTGENIKSSIQEKESLSLMKPFLSKYPDATVEGYGSGVRSSLPDLRRYIDSGDNGLGMRIRPSEQALRAFEESAAKRVGVREARRITDAYRNEEKLDEQVDAIIREHDLRASDELRSTIKEGLRSGSIEPQPIESRTQDLDTIHVTGSLISRAEIPEVEPIGFNLDIAPQVILDFNASIYESKLDSMVGSFSEAAASLREQSLDAIYGASSPAEAAFASAVYAVNSVTDAVVSGAVGTVRLATNAQSRRDFVSGIGTLLTTRPDVTASNAWTAWSAMPREDKLRYAGAALTNPAGVAKSVATVGKVAKATVSLAKAAPATIESVKAAMLPIAWRILPEEVPPGGLVDIDGPSRTIFNGPVAPSPTPAWRYDSPVVNYTPADPAAWRIANKIPLPGEPGFIGPLMPESVLANRRIVADLNISTDLSSQQLKHLPPVTDGRSVLTADPEELMRGLRNGEFDFVRSPKPGQATFDFGRPIGEFWTFDASAQPVSLGQTNFGSVRFGKKGFHIVPANPNQW